MREFLLEIRNDRRRLNTAAVSSLVFLLIAHIYRWTNSMFNHDSLDVYQGDAKWQISLGRFLNPIYVLFRGRLTAPVLVALFGSLFLTAAVVITVFLLHITRISSVILCAGLMTTCETVAFLNASYLLVFDVCMLSLLFSAAAAALLVKGRGLPAFLGAVFCLVCCLGLYQGYLEVTATLILLSFLQQLLSAETGEKSVLKQWGVALAALFASGLLYILCLRLITSVTGISLSGGYNGLTHLGEKTETGLITALWKTWSFPFWLLPRRDTAHRFLSAGAVILAAALTAVKMGCSLYRHRIKGSRLALILLILAVLPLGSNFVFFLSKGLKYGVMLFSFSLCPVMFLMLEEAAENGAENKEKEERKNLSGRVLGLCCGFLVLNQVIFANQLYLKKDLEAQAALSFVTKLTDRMEQTEGYIAGETTIIMLGNIDQNPLSTERRGFDIVNDLYVGPTHHLSLSYYKSYRNYFRNILGYPVKMAERGEMEPYINDPRTQEMGIFPGQDSVKMIDHYLVVRLSEDLNPVF